jgi:class 3 adenylate cyclase
VRHVLPAIRVPTLVMHRTGDLDTNVAEGRWIASQIEGARFVELLGEDHFLFAGDSEPILSEIEEMLTGTKHPPQLDRVLATVLFTDIVGSTRLADEMGDRAWRELLQQHNDAVSRLVASHRGKLIKFTGDGALATFDGPGRAVSCGLAIVRAVKAMGLDVRAGLHTGEIEMLGDDVTGLSVHIASRVVDVAGPGETVASRTVRDLTSGSGHQFVDRGERTLSGVADAMQVFTVTG